MRKIKKLNQRCCNQSKNRYNVFMKTMMTMKQKNLSTQEEFLLYEGICDLEQKENEFWFSYHECAPFNGNVEIKGSKKSCMIVRHAENQSTLSFAEKKQTKGTISSEYGDFEVDFFTHHYIYTGEIFALEYDVMDQQKVIEKFRMMARFKKVA